MNAQSLVLVLQEQVQVNVNVAPHLNHHHYQPRRRHNAVLQELLFATLELILLVAMEAL
jgi:hypothetical protein